MFDGYDLMDKIFVGAMFILSSAVLIVALWFPFTTSKYNAELKECFLQEPKTDDCRFMLWRYEVEHRGGKVSDNSNALTQGTATGIVVSGTTRAAMSK